MTEVNNTLSLLELHADDLFDYVEGLSQLTVAERQFTHRKLSLCVPYYAQLNKIELESPN